MKVGDLVQLLDHYGKLYSNSPIGIIVGFVKGLVSVHWFGDFDMQLGAHPMRRGRLKVVNESR